MKKELRITVVLLIVVSFFTACRKETTLPYELLSSGPGSMQLPQVANDSNYIFDDLTWTQCIPGLSNLWCLKGFGGDIFTHHSYNSNFGSAYYSAHVRLFVKQAQAMLWTNVPYVSHDIEGKNKYGLYFTDDNYVVTLPFGTVNAPRIIIIAKTDAVFDFTKKVSVKMVFI
jgi:hypothetical protein